MNSYLQLIPRYLNRQRIRSIMVIFGLVLAIALLSAAGIIGASIRSSYLTYIQKANGAHHAVFRNVSENQLHVLENHVSTNRIGKSTVIGRTFLPDKGITIAASYLDAEAIQLVNIELLTGSIPQNKHEIALEKWVLQAMEIEPVVGQTFDLTLNLFTHEEAKPVYYTGHFKLTGIMENDPAAQATGYTRGLLSQATLETIGFDIAVSQTDAYIEINSGHPIRSTLTDLQKSLHLDPGQVVMNESLLLILEEGKTEQRAFIILGFIIMLAAAAAIHNIIYISVLERMRQYGLLRSLGTRPGQIRMIVFGEALYLCLLSIPLGLLLGWITVRMLAVTGLYMKNMFTEIVVPVWVIGGTIIFSMLTVLLSVWRPAFLAARVSPMDALRGLRQTTDYKKSQIKVNNIYGKLFGVSGTLADRNIRRHAKSFKVTVMSMSICIILFIVFTSFFAAANPTKILDHQFPGDYVLSTRSLNPQVGYSKDDLALLKQLPGVKHIYSTQTGGVHLKFPFSKLTPEFKEYLQNQLKQDLNKLNRSGFYEGTVGVYSYSENVYAYKPEALVSGEINTERMKTHSEVLIVNSIRRTEGSLPVAALQVGDTLILQSVELQNGQRVLGEPRTVTIAGIFDEYPFPMEMVTIGIGIIVHPDLFAELTGSSLYQRFDLTLADGADSTKLEPVLQTLANSVAMGRVISYTEKIRELQNQKQQVSFLVVGLIGVIVLISLFSIMNTISTTLLLRTREFGILRAIGLTNSQLIHCVRIEGLSYGIYSAIYGAAFGNFIAYLLNLLAKDTATYLAWKLPWQATILAAAGMIILGLIATIAPVKRIAHINIAESLQVTM